MQLDEPRPESVMYFVQLLNRHGCIKQFRTVTNQVYEIERSNGSLVVVYLSNLYIIGETDYRRILATNLSVNCIVTASMWNSFTLDALALGRVERVGLFKMRSFMGAMNYGDFWDYVPPEDREDLSRAKRGA